jgi:alcohol dehydrogenase class IV
MEKQNNASVENTRQQLGAILSRLGAQKALVVCGGTYHRSFLKPFLERLPLRVVYFSEFSPNPSYEDILNGVRLLERQRCDVILSVGGGSVIDVAKCVNAFANTNACIDAIPPVQEGPLLPHICLPTTAGSGSEATRFAVIYHRGEKRSVANDALLSGYVILEPAFLKTLSAYQRSSTLMDALCQAVESYWSVRSTETSKRYAENAIRMIDKHHAPYLRGDSEDVLPFVMQASHESGKAINITQTTAAHAMSYKLTTLYGIAHGHAVALCLPHVWRYMLKHLDACSDPRGKDYLVHMFEDLAAAFGVQNSQQALLRFESILRYAQLQTPALRSGHDLDVLCASVDAQRLGNNPVPLDTQTLRMFYESVFLRP